MKELKIKIYTDGACSSNPGPGGWSALLLIKSDKGKEKVTLRGGEKETTNNRMELKAVIEALRFIKGNISIKYHTKAEIHSDSSYVVNSINNKSLYKWALNGWKTTKNTDVLNQDLWRELMTLINDNDMTFIKVKGHSGNKFNEYVDKVAVEESQKYKKLLEQL